MAGNGASSRAAAPLLLRLVLLGWLARSGVAWTTRGVLHPAKRALDYVGKFCFDAASRGEVGALTVEVRGNLPKECMATDGLQKEIEQSRQGPSLPLPSFPPTDGGVYLALFSDSFGDTDHGWEGVRRDWDQLKCVDFLKRADAVRAVTPTLPNGFFGANVFVSDKVRPRFLYFTFVFCNMALDCDNQEISYTISAQNSEWGYQAEFSMDEMGALPLQFAGAVSFATVFATLWGRACCFGGVAALRTRPLLRLLLLSVGLSGAGCSALCTHFAVYAMDGVGWGAVEVIGELLGCLGRIALSLLQLYVASGKALHQSREDIVRRLFVKSLIIGIVVVSVGCELYGRYFGDLDWSTTLYFYSSWPGVAILGLNTALFAEVCRATLRLLKDRQIPAEVRRFYWMTFLVAVLYFLALPSTCLLAKLLKPWHRRKLVMRVEMGSRFLVSALLAFVLRPSHLDSMIAARLEGPDRRQQAVELAERMAPATSEEAAS